MVYSAVGGPIFLKVKKLKVGMMTLIGKKNTKKTCAFQHFEPFLQF
jgi:hypothetical protein